eukprot:81831-Hanusia_phi.AAC.1
MEQAVATPRASTMFLSVFLLECVVACACGEAESSLLLPNTHLNALTRMIPHLRPLALSSAWAQRLRGGAFESTGIALSSKTQWINARSCES